MTTAEFKDKLILRIDALLSRTLLVWGDDRSLLSAMRSYIDVMPDAEVTRLMTFYHERERKMQKQEMANKLGIDLSKIDWQKVKALIAFLLEMLFPTPMAAGEKPTTEQVKAAFKQATGQDCPDDCCEMLCCHVESVHAAAHAFDAAVDCYQCCCKESCK